VIDRQFVCGEDEDAGETAGTDDLVGRLAVDASEPASAMAAVIGARAALSVSGSKAF
jgi:hypothetical protein